MQIFFFRVSKYSRIWPYISRKYLFYFPSFHSFSPKHWTPNLTVVAGSRKTWKLPICNIYTHIMVNISNKMEASLISIKKKCSRAVHQSESWSRRVLIKVQSDTEWLTNCWLERGDQHLWLTFTNEWTWQHLEHQGNIVYPCFVAWFLLYSNLNWSFIIRFKSLMIQRYDLHVLHRHYNKPVLILNFSWKGVNLPFSDDTIYFSIRREWCNTKMLQLKIQMIQVIQ